MSTIKDLYFYPVKSLRGLRTNEMFFDKQGPRLDRQWLLVDKENKFLTQRTMPSLAKIGVRMIDELELELSRSDIGTTEFALEERQGDEFTVKIWKDEVPAFEVSSEVSDWVSEAVGAKTRLVRLSDNAKRTYSEEFPDQTVRFVDSRPILVLTTGSMKLLEEKTKMNMSVSRFRPNIVIEEAIPHAEDHWPAFKVGSLQLKTIAPCTRCKITTIHPLTGEMGQEPLKTVGTYRLQDKGVTFGQYYANVNTGRMLVGDAITI